MTFPRLEDHPIALNGIDAMTGLPLSSPLTGREFAALTRGSRPGRFGQILGSVGGALARAFAQGPRSGCRTTMAWTRRTRGAWGGPSPWRPSPRPRPSTPPTGSSSTDSGTRGDLLSRRCRRSTYGAGYQLDAWLRGHKAHAADVEPTLLPYYVLLVGGPARSPSRSSRRSTSTTRSAGSASTAPSSTGGTRRADRLRDGGDGPPRPRGRLLGDANRADRATQMSADCLIRPLFEGVPAAAVQAGRRRSPGTGVPLALLVGPEATRAGLSEVLHSRPGGPARVPLHRLARAGLAVGRHERQPPSRGRCSARTGRGRAQAAGRALPRRPPTSATTPGSTAWSRSCSPATGPARRRRPVPGRPRPGPDADRRAAVRRGAAAAAAVAPQRRGAGGGRPRRAGLGLLDPAAGAGPAAPAVPQPAGPGPEGRAGRPRDEGLQRPLRLGVGPPPRIDRRRPFGATRSRSSTWRPPGWSRQRRQELRDPRRPGRTTEGRRRRMTPRCSIGPRIGRARNLAPHEYYLRAGRGPRRYSWRKPGT